MDARLGAWIEFSGAWVAHSECKVQGRAALGGFERGLVIRFREALRACFGRAKSHEVKGIIRLGWLEPPSTQSGYWIRNLIE